MWRLLTRHCQRAKVEEGLFIKCPKPLAAGHLVHSVGLTSPINRTTDLVTATSRYPWRRLHTSSRLANQQPNESNDEEEQKKKEEEQRKRLALSLLISLFGLQMVLYALLAQRNRKDGGEREVKEQMNTEISWTQFVNDYLKKGEVETVYLTRGSNFVFVRLHAGAVVKGRPTSGTTVLGMQVDNPQNVELRIREIERELGIPAERTLKVVWQDFSTASSVLGVVLSLTLIAILFSAFRGVTKSLNMNMMNPFETFTKASYTRGDARSTSSPTVKFSDIAGMHQAKVEVREYVEYLKSPTRFQNLGAKIPKGALLLGPPGCGKTLLAKAVATESQVPFLVMAGSDFVEMIGGLGAARMRTLFKDARSLRPCIIYIDEIDALGRSRGGEGGEGGGGGGFSESESEHTLNQMLVEMDGMTDNSGIIMLASTNRADVLDKALLRPGRFDRHITIELPTLSERKELFDMYLKKISLSKPVGAFTEFLAQATPGMSGADIANICNEAALHAAREARTTVSEGDLAYALDRVIAGQAKMTNTLSPTERKTIAYHECGHVLVSWLLEHTDALLKVSIIPRTGAALGFAQYMPSDKKLYSKEELFEMMCVALGGRAAETVVYNRVTSGAEDDLDKVRQLAYNQVKRFGMGESIGLLSFTTDPNQDFQAKPYSRYLQSLMDGEAQQLVAQAYKTAERLITDNRDKLDQLCTLLLKQEVMTYDDVRTTIGPPPFGEKRARDFSEAIDVHPAPSR